MFLGALSALAFGIGILATVNDINNLEVVDQDRKEALVEMRQIQDASGSDGIKLPR